MHTVTLPRCRRPASYTAQFVILYDFLTYFAWLRLKAVIGDSEVGEYAATVGRDLESCTKALGRWRSMCGDTLPRPDENAAHAHRPGGIDVCR
jgi:hypothetical protein